MPKKLLLRVLREGYTLPACAIVWLCGFANGSVAVLGVGGRRKLRAARRRWLRAYVHRYSLYTTKSAMRPPTIAMQIMAARGKADSASASCHFSFEEGETGTVCDGFGEPA